jgi:hypothetical protein
MVVCKKVSAQVTEFIRRRDAYLTLRVQIFVPVV